MAFAYTGTTGKRGKRVRGIVDARTRAGALRELKEKGVTITSLESVRLARQFFLFGVPASQKVVFTKNLAIMLKSGVPVLEALSILEDQAKGRLKHVTARIRAEVEAGERLADAMARHPATFGPYFVSMVHAGEESGNLSGNLEILAVRFAKDYELRQRAQSAMFYPGLVLMLTFALGAVISVYVLPRLSGLFRAFEFELPWSTRMLVKVSAFLGAHGVAFVALSAAALALTWWVARQPFAAPVVHRLWSRVPIVKGISRSLNLSRFAFTLSSLSRSGIPITDALLITATVLGNQEYRDHLRAVVPRIAAGTPLGEALSGDRLFPPFVTKMVQVGEQTGKLDDALEYLGGFYDTELDTSLKNLSTILEPALLVGIGVIVCAVALSIITPIYNFIGSIE